MERKDVEKKVIKVLAKVMCLEAGNIKSDSLLIDDLGIDSFNVVEILHALQQEFEVDIPGDVATKINKVKDIVDYLVNRKKK